MGEWTEISRKLSATQGLEELDVVGMNQRGARLTARVTASFEDIQRALAGQGLALRNTGGQWVVSQQ
jgi:endonuclease YncB( thermonuclease family)